MANSYYFDNESSIFNSINYPVITASDSILFLASFQFYTARWVRICGKCVDLGSNGIGNVFWKGFYLFFSNTANDYLVHASQLFLLI